MRIVLLSLLCFCATVAKIDHKSKHGKEKHADTSPQAVKEAGDLPHVKQFAETFATKRIAHKAALQSVVDIEDKSKQRLFVEDVLKNIKKLLIDNQDTIQRIGHAADAPFPHDSETLKEALTKVVENIAFFSDLTMRFPKIIRKALKKDRKFKSGIIWCYQYVTGSSLLDVETAKVLHQMAQQLEIIEAEEGFYNPFDKEEARKQVEAANMEKEKQRKEAKAKNKQESKVKKPDSKKLRKEEL